MYRQRDCGGGDRRESLAHPPIGLAKQALQFINPRCFTRAVAGAALLHRAFKFLQQFFLFGRQVHWRFHADAAIKIAGVAAPDVAHALAPEAKQFFTLSTGGNLDGSTPVQRRNFEFAAHHGGGKTHGHLAIEVVLFTLEQRMGLEPNLHEKITRRSAVLAGLAFAREPDLVTLVHAGGNLHRQRLGVLHPASAVTGRTWIDDDLAGAMAFRTGLLDRKESLLHAHLAVAATGAADSG